MWTRYQWAIVLMLLFALVISSIDRVNMSSAAPYWIKHHIMTPTQTGLLQSIFGWSITFFLLFVGPLIDRFHPRRILPFGMVLWFVATFITGLTTKLPVLAFARGLLGLGESTLLPSAPKLIVENIRDADRSKAVSIYFAGNKLGPAIGIPLAAAILVAYGWHAVFYVTSVLSLIWIALWFLIYRTNKSILPERASRSVANGPRVPWGQLFKRRNTWALILGQFGYLYVLYVFLSWLPSYLVLQRHISIGHSGSLGSLPFVISIVTTLLGGILADSWVKKTGRKTLARKAIIGCGLLLSTVFIIIAAFAQNTVPAVIFLCLTMASIGLVTGSVNSLPMDLAEPQAVSSLSSLQNFGGNLGASFAPLITGLMYTSTHSFKAPLILTGIVALVFGCGSYVFLLGRVEKTSFSADSGSSSAHSV